MGSHVVPYRFLKTNELISNQLAHFFTILEISDSVSLCILVKSAKFALQIRQRSKREVEIKNWVLEKDFIFFKQCV